MKKFIIIFALVLLIANQTKAQNLNSTSQDKVFIAIEQQPKYPGGEQALFKYLAQNIKYPKNARENGISGTVYIQFVVEKDGTIEEVKVLRGIGFGCDEEAIRVVKSMPKWKPGLQRGKPVRVSYNIPINFSFGTNKKPKKKSKKLKESKR